MHTPPTNPLQMPRMQSPDVCSRRPPCCWYRCCRRTSCRRLRLQLQTLARGRSCHRRPPEEGEAALALHIMIYLHISLHITDHISCYIHVCIMYISFLHGGVHISSYHVDGGSWVISGTYHARIAYAYGRGACVDISCTYPSHISSARNVCSYHEHIRLVSDGAHRHLRIVVAYRLVSWCDMLSDMYCVIYV